MSSDGHSNYESTNGGPLPPLSLSILGVEPLDEFIKEVADFVHHHISNRPDLPGHIEVEAKIGLLKQKGADDRLKIDILGEAILPTHRSDYHFDSNMSMVSFLYSYQAGRDHQPQKVLPASAQTL
ncbi:hypothetical protein ONZ45_g2401 [Pleurotus djamor]|nr:hypothetical protein ONZ45_g2401 [Pleurotus djamor]